MACRRAADGRRESPTRRAGWWRRWRISAPCSGCPWWGSFWGVDHQVPPARQAAPMAGHRPGLVELAVALHTRTRSRASSARLSSAASSGRTRRPGRRGPTAVIIIGTSALSPTRQAQRRLPWAAPSNSASNVNHSPTTAQRRDRGERQRRDNRPATTNERRRSGHCRRRAPPYPDVRDLPERPPRLPGRAHRFPGRASGRPLAARAARDTGPLGLVGLRTGRGRRRRGAASPVDGAAGSYSCHGVLSRGRRSSRTSRASTSARDCARPRRRAPGPAGVQGHIRGGRDPAPSLAEPCQAGERLAVAVPRRWCAGAPRTGEPLGDGGAAQRDHVRVGAF